MKQKLIITCLAIFLSATAVLAEQVVDYILPLPLAAPQNCNYWANVQIPSQVCKQQAPITYETKRHYFANADFSWRCNIIGSLEFDFFNSSSSTVRTVIIEGTNSGIRLTENVNVPPGQSKSVYVLSSGSFCANEKSARLYFDFRVANGGECLANYSTTELQNMQQTCRNQQAEQLERNTIYNNCFIEKSKGATRTATPSIRAVCRQISENPTMLQRWRWGN